MIVGSSRQSRPASLSSGHVWPLRYGRAVPTLEDVRAIAAALPGSEERATTGGAAWFVRNRVYAWEAYPWPSVAADVRRVIEQEPVFVVKVPTEEDKLAYRQGWPDVFLRQITGWSEPKIAFRLAIVEPELLVELVSDGWYSQAPRYLKRAFDAGASGQPRHEAGNAESESGGDDDDHRGDLQTDG